MKKWPWLLHYFSYCSIPWQLMLAPENLGADAYNKVLIFDKLMDSKPYFLTGNTSTLYVLPSLNMKETGAMVLEVPPGMLGAFNSAWFGYIHVGDHPDYVLKEQNKWVDAIAFHPGGANINIAEYDQMYSVVQKPIMICDHQRSFYTEEYPKTLWQQLPSQELAGTSYRDCLQAALSKPYILGYNCCQYISREVGDVLKHGILDIYGEPYETMVKIITETNKKLIKKF